MLQTEAIMTEAIMHAVAIEYHQSTFKGTPTCCSHSSSVLYETYVAGQEKYGCSTLGVSPSSPWNLKIWNDKNCEIFYHHFPQEIYPSDLNLGIGTFGYSLASGLDMDDNKYIGEYTAIIKFFILVGFDDLLVWSSNYLLIKFYLWFIIKNEVGPIARIVSSMAQPNPQNPRIWAELPKYSVKEFSYNIKALIGYRIMFLHISILFYHHILRRRIMFWCCVVFILNRFTGWSIQFINCCFAKVISYGSYVHFVHF